MSEDKRAQQILRQLENAKNAVDKAHFQTHQTFETEVNIIPDKTVSLGKFLPSKVIVGQYKAHPITIRAMKKNIFAAGDDLFSELAKPYICKCGQNLDIQFWHFCPYCEAEFEI